MHRSCVGLLLLSAIALSAFTFTGPANAECTDKSSIRECYEDNLRQVGNALGQFKKIEFELTLRSTRSNPTTRNSRVRWRSFNKAYRKFTGRQKKSAISSLRRKTIIRRKFPRKIRIKGDRGRHTQIVAMTSWSRPPAQTTVVRRQPSALSSRATMESSGQNVTMTGRLLPRVRSSACIRSDRVSGFV